jgi:hypothetical protein
MFDENLDAVSIRNTEEYCLDGSFFKKGYLIKSAGSRIIDNVLFGQLTDRTAF